jgi:chromosome segregation ATPase
VTITELRKEREDNNMATKNKLKELESLKEREVAQMEEKMRESMDGPLNEVSHLQGKVAALQAQLGDAMQDIAQARKKEEAARGETGKERSRISSIQHELNMATNELESAREEVNILKENSSNAAANEAMLRRLDNERQYLKNQLTSEVTCKNELQETLERTTRQLGEMKAAWKSESENLTLKIRQENTRRDAIETELQTRNQSCEAEIKKQNDQLEELKGAYTKTRDQLRLDQAAVENMRATTIRLAEELKGAQDELVNSKVMTEETQTRHAENMKTVTSTVAQAEDARRRESERLQVRHVTQNPENYSEQANPDPLFCAGRDAQRPAADVRGSAPDDGAEGADGPAGHGRAQDAGGADRRRRDDQVDEAAAAPRLQLVGQGHDDVQGG